MDTNRRRIAKKNRHLKDDGQLTYEAHLLTKCMAKLMKIFY